MRTVSILLATMTGALMGATDELDEAGARPLPRPAHAWRPFEEPGVAAPILEGAPLAFERAFDEALLSWNVDVDEEAGFVVDLRVGRAERSPEEAEWSPWLTLGTWGNVPTDVARTTGFEGGRVDVDVFRSEETWDRLQWRVVATRRAVVRRLDVTATTRRGDERPAPDLPPLEPLRLDVPFRSQQDEDESIRRRVCSPASVAMVLAYHGEERPTAEVAARLFDAEHGIYGNWARAIQGAWTFGVPGRLRRFSDWSEVHDALAAGRPLVASIAFEKGELAGAPFERTSGHLLVLCGFDAAGDVHVNDPAATSGHAVYRRAELDRAWMQRGGTAYEFGEPSGESQSAPGLKGSRSW